jgi:hypothetical protein
MAAQRNAAGLAGPDGVGFINSSAADDIPANSTTALTGQLDFLAAPSSASVAPTPSDPHSSWQRGEAEPNFWIANSESIAVEWQPRIAVYTNTSGAIVVRQENEEPFEDDVWVLVRPENVDALIRALMAERDGRRRGRRA